MKSQYNFTKVKVKVVALFVRYIKHLKPFTKCLRIKIDLVRIREVIDIASKNFN